MSIKNLKSKLFGAVFIAALAALVMTNAEAAPKGDPSPAFKSGAVAVATASATLIPGMGSANAVLIQNLGPNAIYCGGSTVTTATGISVPANGGTLSVDMVQFAGSGTTIKPEIYCIAATALQVSPADTRYMRVK